MISEHPNILGVLGALSVQPNIPKIPGGGANGTDIFLNISFRNFGCNSRGWPKILENSDPFEHSYSGLASPSPEIELSMAASSSVLTDDFNLFLDTIAVEVPQLTSLSKQRETRVSKR